MFWYWKARIYNSDGMYAPIYIKTNRDLREIDAIQDFYFELTECKMRLEGMSETPPLEPPKHGFHAIWKPK
jgi:hypothetical protein